MSETYTTTSNDALTGESVIRNMTSEEIAEFQSQMESLQLDQSTIDAKNAARESALSKLAALGLTQEEIEAL